MTQTFFAPLTGVVVDLVSVPDPVFAGKMVGDGVAIDPVNNQLLAPCDGEICHLHAAHHALTVRTDGGLEVLLHIGLETVHLKGAGLHPRVRVGDRVRRGQPLIDFDLDALAQNAKTLITPMVISENQKPLKIRVLQTGSVQAGVTPLLEVEVSELIPVAAASSSSRATSEPITMALPAGLHARPSAVVVATAKHFLSRITLSKQSSLEKTANAKSLVSLLGLEILAQDVVLVHAEGPDAQSAVSSLQELLSSLREEAHAPIETPVTKAAPSSATVLRGLIAASGVALGRVHQLRSQLPIIVEYAPGSTPAQQKQILFGALAQSKGDLEGLQAQLRGSGQAHQATIFTAHQELLEDPDLIELAEAAIASGKSAAFAWHTATCSHADRLAQLHNELMAQRANDLRDVGGRVLRLLTGDAPAAPMAISEPCILMAENLTPSETASLDRNKVLGFCTTTGGATSHVAILARSLGIPALAGMDARILELTEGLEVLLDAEKGELKLEPSTEEKNSAVKTQQKLEQRRSRDLAGTMEPATTLDGRRIEVAANIGGAQDAHQAMAMGCDGVGLLRSEFLFLQRENAPSENEQWAVYQEIADILGARPLVIRTLDVGGDKPLKYLPLPVEENPFLGLRGLRVGFLYPDLLREQLRAILRVRARGKLCVMFPMVAQLDEFLKAKAMLEEERGKLNAPKVEVGVMIEVPAAALMAESFATQVDFFSIGTNDLTQYTLAMDRGHKEFAAQVDGLHPSVLKLIDITVQAAHRHGKWVGVCGGLASEAKAIPHLISLGVDELSVSIAAIPAVKAQVRGLHGKAARPEARAALGGYL